jgi:lipid-A-disaccharide synthase
MKYYIIAGEASGDLHGSNLIIELKKLDSATEVRSWGGDKIKAAGATLVKHYKNLAFMGFFEVLKNLPTIFKNLEFCKKDLIQFQPDAIILIDYPGFNLRIAKWAKQRGFKVIYYISPQVWAWKESRVKLIKKCVDKMLVILPFEKNFYKKWNYQVEYVGHPLVQVIENFKQRAAVNGEWSMVNEQPSNNQRSTINDQRPTPNDRLPTANCHQPTANDQPSTNIIALLPGSRKQELRVKLPIMLQVAERFPDHHFLVAKAPGIENEFYDLFLAPYKNVGSVSDQTYSLLLKAKAALVTSGTATLETALFNVPEIVCYKGNALSYLIAKKLVKINYIGLVNLIMNKEVVKELIQDKLTVKNLELELQELLSNKLKLNQIFNDYAELKKLLSLGGNASFNAAKSIYNYVTAND